MTQSELNRLDLSSINAVQSVITAAIELQVCQWEQESADAVLGERLSNALMLEHWSFAAFPLRDLASREVSTLLSSVLELQFSSAPPLEDLEVLAEVS